MTQDRPLLRTSVVLLVTVGLVIFLLGSLTLTVFSAGAMCVKVSSSEGGGGTQCEAQDWELPAIGALLTLGTGFGLLAARNEIRSLARRWKTPLFTPVMWTAGTGAFLGLLAYWVVDTQPYAAHVSECIGNECTKYTDVQLIPSIIVAVLALTAAGAFAASALNLWSVWRELPSTPNS